MITVNINDEKYNVNPSSIDIGTYQKHGLNPDARRPVDYLRSVTKTFSTFRDTSAVDSITSYVSGFEIEAKTDKVTETIDWIDVSSDYNIFKIKAGTAIIDNQLINLYENTVYYFKAVDFVANTKYAIILSYSYLSDQKNNVAEIQFVSYDSLVFSNEDDLSSAVYYDINNPYDTRDPDSFGGKPSLVFGTFSINSTYEVVQSIQPYITDDDTSVELKGIDPQFLSRLYMQNHKLLFKHFGDQIKATYATMGLTSANYFTVNVDSLYQIGDTQIDLRSGDFCYLDDETKKYKRSVASRNKFSQVIGLYLFEVSEGVHLIYTSGNINIDAAKYGLPDNHQLLNMQVGQHYFLEDDCSLFDTENQYRTIDNYDLPDSSGRISTRYYTGAVQIGYSVTVNNLLININHSNEISTTNLLEMFGNFNEYQKEYISNSDVISASDNINKLNDQNIYIQNKIDNITTYNGLDTVSSNISTYIATFTSADANISELFVYFLYELLRQKLYDFDTISIHNSIVDTSLFKHIIDNVEFTYTDFTAEQKSLTVDILNNNNNLKDLSGLIAGNITIIDTLITTITTSLNVFVTNFDDDEAALYLSINQKQLQINRYARGDNPDDIDKFENKNFIDNTLTDFSTEISDLVTEIDELVANRETLKVSYTGEVAQIENLNMMKDALNLQFIELEKLILKNKNLLNNYNIEVLSNNTDIINFTTQKENASKNIMNDDTKRLDIFLMDEHQRTIFNYTYLTDRLRKRLFNKETISTNLLYAKSNYEVINANPSSSILDKIAAREEVSRNQNELLSNDNYITLYTEEYNKIRIDKFGILPIKKGDEAFDDGGLANEQLGTYRYGCDDFKTTYGGNASNLMAPTCGPFINENPLVSIEMDSDFTLVEIVNSGHTRNDSTSVNYVDQPQHGTTKIIAGLIYYKPNVGYSGPDHFGFSIIDPSGNYAIGQLYVNIIDI